MIPVGGGAAGLDLTVQHNLLQAFNQLNQSNLRLSTLRRINRGSDDPAGLLAVESLRTELVAIDQAQANAARARSVARVADSGLSQVSGLLNTIRDRVLASAGDISDAERSANQIEIDAAVEALNRIGASTSQGGRTLLDGSSGFQVDGVNAAQIADFQVFARDGGETTAVDIEVTQAASAAELTISDDDGALDEDVTLVVTGGEGSVALEFDAGTSLEDVAAAVAATSDTTGVTAEVAGGELTLSSTAAGSDATVAVEVADGTLALEETFAAGSDVVASVGGQSITGSGNTIEIRTDALQADVTFAEGFTGDADTVTVSGDALRFLIAPDPSDTITFALPNINAAALGGAAGRLSDLISGGSASLAGGNAAQAVSILDTARGQVLTARARLGAFERATIDSADAVLSTAEVEINSAISQISDTDVAAETSRLVRSRLLVDSGLSLLRQQNDRRRAATGLIGLF